VLLLILFGARALVAATLVIAGGAKLADITGFDRTLRSLGFSHLAGQSTAVLAVVVAAVEILLGLWLAIGYWAVASSICAVVLLATFSLVTTVAVVGGSSASCKCFGALGDSLFGASGVFRVLSLTALSVLVAWAALDQYSGGGQPSGSALLVAAGYLLLALASGEASRTIGVIKERYG
jgi:uncharacterized membrane protein YphA (DoxX/SURF4 family)